jgi:hypothetical protein
VDNKFRVILDYCLVDEMWYKNPLRALRNTGNAYAFFTKKLFPFDLSSKIKDDKLFIMPRARKHFKDDGQGIDSVII